MRATIAMGVVFFAAQGVSASSGAGLVVAESRQRAALELAAVAAHRPVGQHALLLSTRAHAGALAGADLPPAAPPPVAGPGETSTAARLEQRDDDPDRSDMAMMVLVALAMLLTVVFRGNRV